MSNKPDSEHFQVPAESITTVIDKGVQFEGKISVQTGKCVLIRGEFTGNIESNGMVIVSQGAVCSGSLTASKIRIAGKVVKSASGEPSSVVATDGLLVERSGVVETDELSYGSIELQYGAKISGAMVPLPSAITEVDSAPAAPAATAQTSAPAKTVETPTAPAVVVPMRSIPQSLLADRQAPAVAPAVPAPAAAAGTESEASVDGEGDASVLSQPLQRVNGGF